MNGSNPDPTFPASTQTAKADKEALEWSSGEFSANSARLLLEDLQSISTRISVNKRKAQAIDRRATAYASRLARHTARLLAHMPDAVPVIRPVRGSGASTLHHYVLQHEKLESPPRLRMLVVSSDGRLRLCTVLVGQRSRLWDDYETADPPVGMGLESVFEGLSSLIAQLEGGVTSAEQNTQQRGEVIEGLIMNSEALLASAGSRLAPEEPEAEELEIDEIFGEIDDDVTVKPSDGTLTSHGFEHRLSLDHRK